jgi:hypothetical protein
MYLVVPELAQSGLMVGEEMGFGGDMRIKNN